MECGEEAKLSSDRGPRSHSAAVAFLDIVGFSALMGANQREAFERWTNVRRSFVVPAIERHSGRYVKSTGDGLLATFPEAPEALDWASEIQRGARARGEGLRMRISLGWGEVIEDPEDGDLHGDCVNIAARLEKHALPGGIILTDDLYDHLPDARDLDLEQIGPLRLRNIARRVKAFRLQTDARYFARPPEQKHLAQLPSIAVLPFESSEQDAVFCAGVVDDLIASLSGVQELNVIARSSVKAIGQNLGGDVRTLGEALGVDFVVQGSVKHSGEAMRIDVELLDAETASVMTTERADFATGQLFEVQDGIAEKIVAIVAPEVRRATLERAKRKPPDNFTAYEHLLRALDKVSSLDRTEFESARSDLVEAIAADPNFSNTHAWYARWCLLRVGQGWSDNPSADFEAAATAAQRAIRIDRRNALALATFGHVCAYSAGDYDTALAYLDRAVECGPNNAIARILRSGTLSFLGRAKEAREEAEKALRLSPFDEQLFQFYGFLSLACYADEDYGEAARWARRSLTENPNYTHTLKVLIVSLVAQGEIEAAQAAASKLLEKEPEFRTGRYLTHRAPFRDRAQVELLVERFEQAGIER